MHQNIAGREKLSRQKGMLSMAVLTAIGFLLFCCAHLLLMQNIRVSQAETFVATQRNGLLLGERRAYLVAVEQQKNIFPDIVLSNRAPSPEVESAPFRGKISWPIFFDEKKQVPFGVLVFTYNPWLHSQWMILAFLLTAIGGYYAAIRAMHRADRDRQKDQALWHSRALTTSIQMIAHDVRKPLATTQRFLTLLSDSDPNDRSEIISKFKPVLMRSLEDVTNLLYEAGAGEPPPIGKEPLNLFDVVQQAIASCVGGRNDRNVTIDVPNTIQILADRRALIRVLHNLLDNACKESPDGGDVWVRAVQDEHRGVRIIVGNSGSFIPESERGRVFDTFYTRSKRGGQGLGLSLVKKVMEAHGGTIDVFSSLSKGTEFALSFPQAEPASVQLQ